MPDGLSVPDEIARRETQLSAIAEAKAKAKIEAPAKERYAREKAEFDAKMKAREEKAVDGKKPRGKAPTPPRETPRAEDQVNLTDDESRIMKTRAGKQTYALRKQTVEQVFGIIKSVMKFRQFMLRGLANVKNEWTLVCLAWNLKRMAVLRPKSVQWA